MGDAQEAAAADAEPEILKRCFRRAGQVYWGECIQQDAQYIRQGHGLQVWGAQTVGNEAVVASKYHGSWVNGKMTGSGKMEFYDTSVYSGDFDNGDLHGVGQLTWPDGTTYEGGWHKCAIFIKYMAQMRRRKQNYTGQMYNTLQEAIVNGLPVPIVFDDPGQAEMPEAWRLEHFYDTFSAPREMFNPRLFHGRGFVEFFLPDDLQEHSVFTKTFPAPPPPPPVSGDAAADPDVAPPPMDDSVVLEDEARQTAYTLSLRCVALARLRSEIVDDHELVRHELKQRFGSHLPLHRCGIIILSGGIGDLGITS